MRLPLFIITTLIAFSTKAQIAEKELKTSGSIILPATKDTAIGHYTHDAPLIDYSKVPLLIVDGKRKPFDSMSQIDLNSIAKISVIKGKEARKKYGRKIQPV